MTAGDRAVAGRLSGVIRRTRPVALLAIALLGLSACTTFTDDDVAARVGDVELTHEELAEVLETEGVTGDGAQAMRNFAGLFVATEALKAELDALGVGAESVDGADLTLEQRLGQEFELNRNSWQSLSAEQLRDDRTRSAYESPDGTLICTAHILTGSEAEAEAAIAEIEAGASFAEVAQARSIDPGSAGNGGQLGCLPEADFATTFVPEFVDGALPLEIGEISPPIESRFGMHVITKVGFDDLAVGDLLQLRLGTFEDRYDIHVDPQLGQWTAAGFIAPLG